MIQRKVCSNCGKVYSCNQECGLERRKREHGCFCAECYIQNFHSGDAENLKEKIISHNREVCKSRFGYFLKMFKREKVEFT